MTYLERFRLDGRVAFITGGAQGIGLAIAEALAEAGATVTIGDLNEAVLGAATSALSEPPSSVDDRSPKRCIPESSVA